MIKDDLFVLLNGLADWPEKSVNPDWRAQIPGGIARKQY
jgi:hypothetical protein